MVFKAEKKKSLHDKTITINGIETKKANYTKFPGQNVDDELSWKYHINQVTTKISKMTGIIAKARHYISLKSFITIYNTMIYPYLLYCNIIWTSTYPTRLQASLNFIRLLPVVITPSVTSESIGR